MGRRAAQRLEVEVAGGDGCMEVSVAEPESPNSVFSGHSCCYEQRGWRPRAVSDS